jgi:hypothetical protein
MNYWHMQLEPSKGGSLGVDKVKEIINKNLIGMGHWKEDGSQQNDFENKMKINDIVLVRSGGTAIALVKVIGAYFYDESKTDGVWFERRRKIKVLDILNTPKKGFPQSRGTIQLAKDKTSSSYRYIDNWYRKIQREISMKNLIVLLENQKQIILQGPPGTGKTRLAKEIARFIVKGEVDPKIDDIEEQVKLIQFHPSYSYEDFVRGIVAKATATGTGIEYKTEDKVLADMAKEALKSQQEAKEKNEEVKPYILIIDEINRANLSSVLGELIYALEYRDEAVESMYEIEEEGVKHREITLPSNLYIIGTMNTADRSIGHIDYAIRRRFTFIDVLANENNILNKFPMGNKLYENTVKIFTSEYVSPEFNIEDIKIGHSYFIATKEGSEKEEDIDKLVLKYIYQVLPLLKEYEKDGIFKKSPKITLGDFTIDLSQKIDITSETIKEFITA